MYSLVRLLPSQRDIRPTRVNRLIKSGKCRWRVCHLLFRLAINLRPSGQPRALPPWRTQSSKGLFFIFWKTDPAPPCFRRRPLSVPADFYVRVRGPASSDDGLSLARSLALVYARETWKASSPRSLSRSRILSVAHTAASSFLPSRRSSPTINQPPRFRSALRLKTPSDLNS